MSDFDPFAYAREVKANPENYVPMAQIVADAQALQKIRKARTIQDLKEAFHGPAKAAKTAGDDWLVKKLTEAKDERKKQLEAR